MRNPWTLCALISLAVGWSPNSSFAANTHLITADKAGQKVWAYKLPDGTTKSISDPNTNPPTPVVVDDLAVGDIIEIDTPQGNHGFITTKNGAEDTDLVAICGEDPNTKKTAVLQEISCAAGSQFGQTMKPKASMQMVVLPTFNGETDFWCWVHKGEMPGVLKLKQ
jgi:hypothetical protein